MVEALLVGISRRRKHGEEFHHRLAMGIVVVNVVVPFCCCIIRRRMRSNLVSSTSLLDRLVRSDQPSQSARRQELPNGVGIEAISRPPAGVRTPHGDGGRGRCRCRRRWPAVAVLVPPTTTWMGMVGVEQRSVKLVVFRIAPRHGLDDLLHGTVFLLARALGVFPVAAAAADAAAAATIATAAAPPVVALPMLLRRVRSNSP
mmetsp:Transcript_32909/g.97107  ORF Transcript_32909/g.97107 Transcript_32909/m.97107 type:complete len:202 (+) Transcript_32909:1519-2124(+)